MWLLKGGFGHHMLNIMSMYSPMFEICLIYPHVFLLEGCFMHEIWLGRRDDSHMMWYEGSCLYYVDETFHMSIIVLLLHDPHVDKARRLQKSLLLWLLLGEYGYYPIAHHFLNHALDFNDML